MATELSGSKIVLHLAPYFRTGVDYLINFTLTKSYFCAIIYLMPGTFGNKNNFRHGLIDVPEYNSYRGMLQRCYNPSNSKFPDYGGRGITVCKRWLGRNGFIHFYNDMGPKPGRDHSLDRKDTNGNYEPDNCRWATVKEQARNKRNSRPPITFNGETRYISDWAEETGITKAAIVKRLHLGWPVEKILTLPVGQKKQKRRSS